MFSSYFRNLFFYFYLHGPIWLGFWNSKSYPDICTSIVNNGALDSNFWIKHMEECSLLIDNHFLGYCASISLLCMVLLLTYIIGIITYFIVLWGISSFLIRPFLVLNNDMKRLKRS